MQDYITIEAVLQAEHMSKHKRRPRHLKKYQISSCNTTLTHRNSQSVALDASCIQANYSKPVILSPRDGRPPREYILNCSFSRELNKMKTNYILTDREQIEVNQDDTYGSFNMNVHEDFFTSTSVDKNKTKSKSKSGKQKQLVKTPAVMKGLFYDINMETICKKSQRCLILPERNGKTRTQQQKKFRNLTKNEARPQEHRKRGECKTATNFRRETKNNFQVENNSCREEERHGPKQGQKGYVQLNEVTIPLSKEQLRQKTSLLMRKYRIETGKYKLLF